MTAQLLAIGNLGSGTAALSKKAQTLGMKLMLADSTAQGLSILCDSRVDMAFLSVDSDMSGFFREYNAARLNTPVVVMGPASKVQNAVAAIRLGAIEYLSVPVEEALLSEILKKVATNATGGDGPIAGDAKTKALLDTAKKFAASNATVLLRGESGTGKEVISRFIHFNSPRRNGPFISVNCAAIPENLLESELFGHEKGAFSGALAKRVGKFEQANGGTLLLDEISEMDLGLQAKLLRAIQERVIDPVGASKPVTVDIRLIATTNRDLEKEVAKGTFREDLYFRLNVVALDLLPLRERPGDILPLAQHFASTYGEQNGFKKVTLQPDAITKLQTCYWKGNVRELENTLHRAVLMMTDGNLRAEHIVFTGMSRDLAPTGAAAVAAEAALPAAPLAPTAPVNPVAGVASAYAAAGAMYEGKSIAKPVLPTGLVGRTVHDVERELILSTLDYCNGNRTHAANILGISIRTLRNKLKEYRLDDTPDKAAEG